MQEALTSSPQFGDAPQSTTGFAASLLEPVVTVGTYLAALTASGETVRRWDLTLCLFVLVLMFPGRNRFYQRPLNALVDIAVSWVSLLAVLFMCGWVTDSLRLFDMPVLLAWAAIAPTVMAVVTLVGIYLLRRHANAPSNRRTAIIIGAGALGARLAAALGKGRIERKDLLGYFDDRDGDRIDERTRAFRIGMLSEAAPYVREHGVQDVYITLPLSSQPRIQKLVQDLQGTTASIYLAPDLFGVSIIQGRLRDLNGVPLVGLCETPFTGVNSMAKRISDLVICLLLMPVILPVMALVAIGVKLSSPGPILFRQRRNGIDGREIVVYKFRSMRVMEDGAQVRQATRGDPRITPFGAFIRRTSLDELPQFLNVLQGRMSIVGPRPHAVAHNEAFADVVRSYMVRHKVKPGITGLAQVNGLRGETDTVEKMAARVEADLAYLRNWSLTLDMQIIARTIKLILFDRHAY